MRHQKAVLQIFEYGADPKKLSVSYAFEGSEGEIKMVFDDGEKTGSSLMPYVLSALMREYYRKYS